MTHRTYRTHLIAVALFACALFLFSASSVRAAAVSGNSPVTSLQNGLVGYWTFDGQHTNWATGKTYDQSGKENHGTLTSMSSSTAPTAGKLGQALKFDGVNDYINAGDNGTTDFGTGNFSISFWHKRTSGTSIVTKGAGSIAGYSSNWVNATTIRLQVEDGTDAVNPQFTVSNTNTWRHYVFSVNKSVATGISFYLDGVLKGCSGNCSYDLTIVGDISNSISLGIGTRNTGNNGSYIAGDLDEVRLYNRALSAAEIKRLYSLGAAKFANSPVTSLQNGLVGYWTFDGQHTNWATGKTYDQSGKGNHGTLTSMSTSTAPVAGRLGQGLNFDGVDDYVNMGSVEALQMNGNITISAWIKARSFATNEGILGMMGAGEASSLNAMYLLYFDASSGNDIGYLHENASGEDSRNVFDTNLSANTWYHVMAVRDTGANTVKLYVNGAQSGSTYSYTTDPNGGSSSVLHIGRTNSAAAPANEMDGLIDEVRLYNRALSATEVQRLYSLGAAKFANSPVTSLQSGLVGYWTFDGQHTNWANGKTYDQSGKGNHGTLTNMSTSTAPTAGKLGQALKFDGVDDYVNVGDVNALDNISQMTVSYWVKLTSLQLRDYHVTKANTASSDYGWAVHATDDTDDIRFETRNPAGTVADGYTTGSFLVANKWIQVSVVYDGTQADNATRVKIFTDGVQRGLSFTGTIPAVLPDTTNRLVLGWTHNAQANLSLGGLLDDVRIYNRALGAGEIQRLYQMGR